MAWCDSPLAKGAATVLSVVRPANAHGSEGYVEKKLENNGWWKINEKILENNGLVENK